MKKYFLLVLLFMANAPLLFADDPGGGLPCDGTDPDPGACPIDTWVVMFAAMVLILTTWYLYKKQKDAPPIALNN